MRALALAVLLGASNAWGAGQGTLLLERPGWQVEEAALMQGLRIYTQDLEIPFRTGTVPAAARTFADEMAAAVTACATDVSVVLWFGGNRLAPSLLALHCASRELRDTPLSPTDDLDLAAQTLALKVRWLLTKHAPQERDVWRAVTVPLPPTHPGDRAPPAGPTAVPVDNGPTEKEPVRPPAPPEPPRESPAANAVPAVTQPTLAAARAVAPVKEPRSAASRQPEPMGTELGLGYAVDTSADVAWLRHAVVARVAVPLLRGKLALTLDGSLGSSAVAQFAADRATLSDYPVGIALLPRLRHSRWTLGLGPRASLHVLSAEGTGANGRTGSSYKLALGLGGLGEAQLRVSGPVRLAITFTAEYLVPRCEFTVDGQKALDYRPLRAGGGAGLVYVFH